MGKLEDELQLVSFVVNLKAIMYHYISKHDV